MERKETDLQAPNSLRISSSSRLCWPTDITHSEYTKHGRARLLFKLKNFKINFDIKRSNNYLIGISGADQGWQEKLNPKN